MTQGTSITIEDNMIQGILKKDIEIVTPYGKMKVAAVGRKSGYSFDFAYYENGNLAIIWLREEKTVFYDSMSITLPLFKPDQLLRIAFYDNFNIRSCRAVNSVTYLGYKLPENTSLHFSDKGTLKSFTIFQDWILEGVQYSDGQQFQIRDGKIVPWS